MLSDPQPLPLPVRSAFRIELAAAARLAAPVATIQFGLMLMGVVDTMMLGRLSANALAAGALGHIVTITLLMFGAGVLSALDPLAAQAWGAGDRDEIAGHLQRGVVLALVMSVPFALLLWDVRWLFRLLGQPPEVIGDPASYARMIIAGFPAYLVFLAFRQTLQAMGIVRPAAVAIVFGNLVNVVVNYALIFGHFGMPALGVAGSACSTSFARWTMLFWLLIAARRQLAPIWRGFTSEAVALARHARLLRIGLPIGFHNSIEICVFATVGMLMGTMGVAALGGHQIALNLASLSFMVPMGVSGAAATRVGNAIGRGDMPGARRAAGAGLILGVGAMSVFAVIFASVPGWLARLYTTDAAVIAMASALLPIAAVFQVFDGAQVVSAGVLRGGADTTFPAAFALVGFWAIGLPAGWYLAFRAGGAGHGPVGLWWGLTIGLAAVATLFLLRIYVRFRGTIARAES